MAVIRIHNIIYMFIMRKTCPVCQSFIKHVIPPITETEYGPNTEIIEMDIDEAFIRCYAKHAKFIRKLLF